MTAEQQQDGAAERVEAVGGYRGRPMTDAIAPDARDGLLAEVATCQSTAERVRQTHAFRARNGHQTRDYDDADVLAVLDNREQWRNLAYKRSIDRDALAARVAELESERAADVRAVGTLLEADDEDVPRAREYLRARFASRIDTLINRSLKAGGQE